MFVLKRQLIPTCCLLINIFACFQVYFSLRKCAKLLLHFYFEGNFLELPMWRLFFRADFMDLRAEYRMGKTRTHRDKTSFQSSEWTSLRSNRQMKPYK